VYLAVVPAGLTGSIWSRRGKAFNATRTDGEEQHFAAQRYTIGQEKGMHARQVSSRKSIHDYLEEGVRGACRKGEGFH